MGDGGALMMGNEIATACQYSKFRSWSSPTIAMYGTIGMHSYVRYPDRKFMDATRLTNPDFAGLGAARSTQRGSRSVTNQKYQGHH